MSSLSDFFEQLTDTAPDASVTAARIKNFEAALRIIVRVLLGGTSNELGPRTYTDPVFSACPSYKVRAKQRYKCLSKDSAVDPAACQTRASCPVADRTELAPDNFLISNVEPGFRSS